MYMISQIPSRCKCDCTLFVFASLVAYSWVLMKVSTDVFRKTYVRVCKAYLIFFCRNHTGLAYLLGKYSSVLSTVWYIIMG